MIQVTERNGLITVSGHANYKPTGEDIVCAAISTLTQTFIESLTKLSTDKIKWSIERGMAEIEYENLSEQGLLLKESFFIGVGGVANAYPENVNVSRKASPSIEDGKSYGR